MKRSLRVTLLTVLLGLTIITVVLIGVTTYLNARATAHDLARQILDQTAERIDQQIDDLVQIARRQVTLNEHLFRTGFLGLEELTPLAEFWVEDLKSYYRLSALYVTNDSDGITVEVARLPDRGLTVQILRPGPDGRFEAFSYPAGSFRERAYQSPLPAAARLVGLPPLTGGPLFAAAALPTAWSPPFRPHTSINLDQRVAEWYRLPWRSGQPTWVDTELAIDEVGEPSYQGVTFASPVRDKDGNRFGVLGLDFNVYALCDYLRELTVTEGGYAFLVEQHRDGRRHLIAHPDPDIVLSKTSGQGGRGGRKLIPPDELKDDRVRTFLRHVPDSLNPETMRGKVRFEFRVDGVKYLGAYRGLEEEPGTSPNWLICI